MIYESKVMKMDVFAIWGNLTALYLYNFLGVLAFVLLLIIPCPPVPNEYNGHLSDYVIQAGVTPLYFWNNTEHIGGEKA